MLAAIAAAGAAGVRAADTLGATVEAVLYADEDRTLTVLNRSSGRAVFAFEPSGGWSVEPEVLTLTPDEQASVEVAAIGDDGAPLAVRVTGAAPVPDGAQRGELLLTSTLYTERPADPLRLVFVLALVAAALAIGAGALYWSLRLRRTLPR